MHARRHAVLRLGIFLVGLAACSSDRGNSAALNHTPIRPQQQMQFSEVFSRIRTITPEQDAAHPINRLSGIDFDDQMNFLIADGGEGNVRVFSSDGRRQLIIGRPGKGPGEFSDPSLTRFGPEGSIWTADAGNQRITEFSASGEILKEIRLPRLKSRMTGFDLLPDGRMLVSQLRSASETWMPGQPDALLQVLDVNGNVTKEYAPVRNLWPTEATRYSPYFEYFGQVFFSRVGNIVTINTPVSDTLWTVNLGDGTVARQRFAFDGYEPVAEPDDPKIEFRQWMETVQKTMPPLSNDETTLITFVNGFRPNGDPSITLLRRNDGQWITFRDGPPIIYAERDFFVTIENPLKDPVVLGLYRLRE